MNEDKQHYNTNHKMDDDEIILLDFQAKEKKVSQFFAQNEKLQIEWINRS